MPPTLRERLSAYKRSLKSDTSKVWRKVSPRTPRAKTSHHVAATDDHLTLPFAIVKHPSWMLRDESRVAAAQDDSTLPATLYEERLARARKLDTDYRPPEAVGREMGSSSLAWAARSDSLSAAEDMLARGADVEEKDPHTGTTPLHWAAARGSVGIVRALIAAGARAGATDLDGATPLMLAAERGHLVVVELLCAAGADPSAADRDGVTALHAAAARRHGAVVAQLMAAGAAAGAVDSLGYTAETISGAFDDTGDIAEDGKAAGSDRDRSSRVIEDEGGEDEGGVGEGGAGEGGAGEGGADDCGEEEEEDADEDEDEDERQTKAMLLGIGYSPAQIKEATIAAHGDVQGAAERLLDANAGMDKDGAAALSPSHAAQAGPPLRARRAGQRHGQLHSRSHQAVHSDRQSPPGQRPGGIASRLVALEGRVGLTGSVGPPLPRIIELELLAGLFRPSVQCFAVRLDALEQWVEENGL